MRARAIRERIITAVVETTVDDAQSVRDRFAVWRRAGEPTGISQRTVMVKLLTPPTKDETNTCDRFRVSHQLVMFYPIADNTEDRVASDVERLYTPLWRLHEDDADYENSEVSEPSIEELDGMLVVRMDVLSTYRLDAGLVT